MTMRNKDEFARSIVTFLREHGIDPFYAVTIIWILIFLWFAKDIPKWTELNIRIKIWIVLTLIGSVFFTLVSVARLVGIAKF